MRIWTQYRREHPAAERLPPIVCAVLQHDPQGSPPPSSFAELLDADDAVLAGIEPFVPDFRFVLDNLRHVDDEELKRRSMAALGRLALWCLKHGRDVGEMAERLAQWADVFWEVRRAPHGLEAIRAVMRYIRRVNDTVPSERLERLFESVLDAEFREVYVTEGERLIQQGFEQGIEQGIEQGVVTGARRVLLRLLETRFGKVDDVLLARVEAASEEQIERWAQRVLDAEKPEDVIA